MRRFTAAFALIVALIQPSLVSAEAGSLDPLSKRCAAGASVFTRDIVVSFYGGGNGTGLYEALYDVCAKTASIYAGRGVDCFNTTMLAALERMHVANQMLPIPDPDMALCF